MTPVIPCFETSGKSALRVRKSLTHAATTGFFVKSVLRILSDPTVKHKLRTCTKMLRLVITNRSLTTAESRKWFKAREASHVSVVIFLETSRNSPAQWAEATAPPRAIRTQLVRW